MQSRAITKIRNLDDMRVSSCPSVFIQCWILFYFVKLIKEQGPRYTRHSPAATTALSVRFELILFLNTRQRVNMFFNVREKLCSRSVSLKIASLIFCYFRPKASFMSSVKARDSEVSAPFCFSMGHVHGSDVYFIRNQAYRESWRFSPSWIVLHGLQVCFRSFA